MPYELVDANGNRFRLPSSLRPAQLHIGGEPRGRIVRGYGSERWFRVEDGIREPDTLDLVGVIHTDRDDAGTQDLLNALDSAARAAVKLVLVDHFGQDVKEISLLGGLPPTVEPDGVDGSLVRVTLPLVPGSSDWRPPHGDQSDSGYAPGPSQPSDIPGLVAWWKADALTLADDDPVATWPDSSGNGHDLAQATSDRRPTFKAGVLNGRPIVRFDGGDVLATSATSAPGNTFTLFAVAQVTSAGLRSIIDKDRNTTPRIFQFRWLGGNAELIGFNAVGGSPVIAQHSMSLNEWVVISGVRRSSDVQVFVDGSAGVASAAASANTVDSMPLYVGGFDNGGTITPNFVGDMAELLVYDGDLSDANREAVEIYLASKWGVT